VTFSRFDVVVVNYPFIEGDQAKRRPALIVSGGDLEKRHGVYWAMMITTAKAGARADDVPISNFETAGLPEPCVIRPTRLTTLAETMILRRLGTIAPKDRNAVAALLKRWLPT
jgi:mRNA interferase MazF